MEDTNLKYTQIQVTKDTWRELIKLKNSPDQTFNDIIQILIKNYNSLK